jgi:hypothetical protein
MVENKNSIASFRSRSDRRTAVSGSATRISTSQAPADGKFDHQCFSARGIITIEVRFKASMQHEVASTGMQTAPIARFLISSTKHQREIAACMPMTRQDGTAISMLSAKVDWFEHLRWFDVR